MAAAAGGAARSRRRPSAFGRDAAPGVGRRLLLLAPSAIVFGGLFLAPLASFLVISFWSVRAMKIRPDLTLANYAATWEKYAGVAAATLGIGLATAVLTTVVAFGFAYVIRFKTGRLGPLLLFLTLVTLFGGYLVKIYAWKSILGKEGILNSALVTLGLVDEPLTIFIYNPGAVIVTLTHFLLPLAVLPVYGSLRSVRDITLEAARDLGARRGQVLLGIVIPQCRAGLFAAFALSFLVASGDYVTPRFVGGPYTAMMGDFIETQFSLRFNWPMGSAMSFSVLAACALVLLVVRAALPGGRR